MCLWNPKFNILASGSSDGMCRLWHMTDVDQTLWKSSGDGESLRVRTTSLPHTDSVGERNKDVTAASWSPDGLFLATGCYDGSARVWNQNGGLKYLMIEHSGPLFSIKWNKSGSFILTGSYDKKAIVWSSSTGLPVKRFSIHTAPVLDVDWRDDDMFSTCSSDRCEANSMHTC